MTPIKLNPWLIVNAKYLVCAHYAVISTPKSRFVVSLVKESSAVGGAA
jgi:hypothetical protein